MKETIKASILTLLITSFFYSNARSLKIGDEYAGGITSQVRNTQNEEFRDLPFFDKVSVSAKFKVVMEKGSTNSVRIETSGIDTGIVLTEVSGSSLKIGMEKGNHGPGTVSVYLTYESELTAVEASVASTVIGKTLIRSNEMDVKVNMSAILDLDVDADDVKVEVRSAGEARLNIITEELDTEISSAGRLEISGHTNFHRFKVSEGGQMKAYGLSSKRVKAAVSSSGIAEINVSEEIDADASGGIITYKGYPERLNVNGNLGNVKSASSSSSSLATSSNRSDTSSSRNTPSSDSGKNLPSLDVYRKNLRARLAREDRAQTYDKTLYEINRVLQFKDMRFVIENGYLVPKYVSSDNSYEYVMGKMPISQLSRPNREWNNDRVYIGLRLECASYDCNQRHNGKKKQAYMFVDWYDPSDEKEGRLLNALYVLFEILIEQLREIQPNSNQSSDVNTSNRVQGLSIQELYRRRNQAYDEEDFQLVIFYSESLIRQTPQRIDAFDHMMMAQAYEGLGKDAEAESSYLKGVELRPNDDDFLFRVGSFFDRKKSYQNAIIYFEKYREFNPRDAEIFRKLSYLYAHIGEIDKYNEYQKIYNEWGNR